MRFTDHEDGTVTDSLTGLMWTKDANMYGRRIWAKVFSDCESCTVGGYNDWRLPTVKELQSLIDFDRHDPALPVGHPFSNVQSSCYWSSSTHAYGTGFVWLVPLFNGGVGYYGKGNDYYVWCVRGGK